MINWGRAKPSRDGLITNFSRPVHYSDNSIGLQFTSFFIVVVSVELQDFYPVAHIVFVQITESIYIESSGLIEVLYRITP
ncbi:hypothetical protein [Pseudomonas phage PPAY]|nr:hypothetical protein [Pseudomonas phage PPAY]